jgi:cation diffusion facilitator CzcD-associated flavoprotein CzcO
MPQGKRVAVLGAGASGLDLMINALKINEDK